MTGPPNMCILITAIFLSNLIILVTEMYEVCFQ